MVSRELMNFFGMLEAAQFLPAPFQLPRSFLRSPAPHRISQHFDMRMSVHDSLGLIVLEIIWPDLILRVHREPNPIGSPGGQSMHISQGPSHLIVSSLFLRPEPYFLI